MRYKTTIPLMLSGQFWYTPIKYIYEKIFAADGYLKFWNNLFFVINYLISETTSYNI